MNTEDSFSIHPAADGDLLQLTDVWEVSVRATHHFLKEEDLLFYKNQIGHYLKECNLFLVRAEGGKKQFQNSNSRIVGFIGIQDRMIEMLFIHPAYRHQGIGSRLMEYACQEFGCNRVDVNEQNKQAVRFYLNRGFWQTGRDAYDGSHRPYPILHLELSPTEQTSLPAKKGFNSDTLLS